MRYRPLGRAVTIALWRANNKPPVELVVANLVVGTSLIGILLIVSGVCDLFVKKTKEMEIEENDERNISLSNAAMASGFKVMNVTIAVSIFALIFTGYMTVVPCFTIIGAYAIGQIVFIVRLWYLHKTM